MQSSKPSKVEPELFTIYDRLAAHEGYIPSMVLLPASDDGSPDIDTASPSTCGPMASDDWPDDAAIAARVAVMVDRVPGVSPDTVFIVHTANGGPEVRLISGPEAEGAIGETLIRFHAMNMAPERPRGPLSVSMSRLLGKYQAANDNAASAQSKSEDVGPRLKSSAELVRGFTPPDYHIEGVIQRGYLYSMTASTGTGKTAVALLIALLTERGENLGTREITQGRVVYFAGENDDDVTMRWIGMCHEQGVDPDILDVHFITERFSIPNALDKIRAQVEALGGAGLVIVDTSAAYFQGEDENGNTALGAHARDIRELTKLPGRPCVVVLCHPTKNAANDNMLPRGGGAFLAEVDGNLTLTRSDEAVRLHWQGKHRGADFKPISFGLQSVTAPQLVDSKGRSVPTVMAVLVGDDELRETRRQQRRDEDEALILIQNGKKSYSEIAEAAGWKDKNRETHKRRAQTACEKLKASKLAEYKDRVGWRLTKDGEDAAQAVRAEMHRMDAAKGSIRNMTGDDDD